MKTVRSIKANQFGQTDHNNQADQADQADLFGKFDKFEKTMSARTKSARKGNGAATPRDQVIAVVIKQYGSGLYRTCVSLDKDDVTFLSTHKDERSANETISLFWRAYDEGQLKTHEDVESFINAIHPKTPTPPPIAPFPNQGSINGIHQEPAEQYFTPLAA